MCRRRSPPNGPLRPVFSPNHYALTLQRVRNTPYSSGAASLTISSLSVGYHSITATYSGNQHTDGSTSLPFTQTITGTTTFQVVATSGQLTHLTSITASIQ